MKKYLEKKLLKENNYYLINLKELEKRFYIYI